MGLYSTFQLAKTAWMLNFETLQLDKWCCVVVGLFNVLGQHFETMVDKKTELLLLKAPLVDYGDDHLPGKLTDDGQQCKCEKHSTKPGDYPIRTSLFRLSNTANWVVNQKKLID